MYIYTYRLVLAAGLRDTHLLPIFNNAYTILNNLLLQTMHFDKPDQENRTKDATLNLILRCLSYDFAGTSTDEAGEDSGVVQVNKQYKQSVIY